MPGKVGAAGSKAPLKRDRDQSEVDDGEEPCAAQSPVIQILGDIFTDILAVVPPPGFKVGGDTLSKINVLAGGSGLNVSIHLSAYLKRQRHDGKHTDSSRESNSTPRRLSHHTADISSSDRSPRVAMFSCIGDDLHGQMCSKHLQDAGIDISGVRVSKHGFKTGSCIVLSSSSERSFVTDAACISEELALPLFMHKGSTLFRPPACHFHISGYFNLNQLRASGAAQLRDALTQAKQKGLPTSLNPQYDSLGLWDGVSGVGPARTAFLFLSSQSRRSHRTSYFVHQQNFSWTTAIFIVARTWRMFNPYPIFRPLPSC